MRVAVVLEERIDPSAARALWRLLFGDTGSAPGPEAAGAQETGLALATADTLEHVEQRARR